MRVGALLLAAGFSNRFGGLKLLAPLNPEHTVFSQTHARLSSAIADLIVITRPELADKLPVDRSQLQIFAEAERGMGATLAFGMQFTNHWDACMICLSDMPYITTATYSALAEAAATNSIIIPEFDGKPGNPVIFGSDFFPELKQLSGDAGGKPVTRAHPEAVRRISVDDPAILLDIDTPEELAELQDQQEET